MPGKTLWVLVNVITKLASYLSISTGDRPYIIGPFVFSTKADAELSMQNIPAFKSGTAKTEVVGISTEELQQSLNRLHPSEILVVNEHFVPLTDYGAKQSDVLKGRDFWVPIFQARSEEDSEQWILPHEVRFRIFVLLGLAESSSAELETTKSRFKKHCAVHVEPSSGTTPETHFTLYTTGMWNYDCQDLEINDVPALFLQEAEQILASWATFSLDNPLTPGSEMVSKGCTFNVRLRVGTGSKGRLGIKVVEVYRKETEVAGTPPNETLH